MGADRARQSAPPRADPEARPGVGGHCIAVDPWFIVDAAPQKRSDPHGARGQYGRLTMFCNASTAHRNPPRSPRILPWLTFKANVDDLAKPGARIVERLAEVMASGSACVEPLSSGCLKLCANSASGVSNWKRRWRRAASGAAGRPDVFRDVEEAAASARIIYDTRGADDAVPTAEVPAGAACSRRRPRQIAPHGAFNNLARHLCSFSSL